MLAIRHVTYHGLIAMVPMKFIRWQIVGILLCMVTARSLAMAFNRLADRQLDAQNPRTAGRHLPAGILQRAAVTAFAAAMCDRLRAPARCCSCPTGCR